MGLLCLLRLGTSKTESTDVEDAEILLKCLHKIAGLRYCFDGISWEDFYKDLFGLDARLCIKAA